MNKIIKKAIAAIFAAGPRKAQAVRADFLLSYPPEKAQELLDTLHKAWHFSPYDIEGEEAIIMYGFYKRLSLMIASEYMLLKEGRRWQKPSKTKSKESGEE